MATLNQTFPTLLDAARRTDPNGSIARMVEQLTKKSAILEDATFIEGNLPTGHRFTSRTALPGLTWRKFNEGLLPTKSGATQVDETVGSLEGMSKVDVELAKLNGNEAAFRASEDSSFMQAMTNEAEAGLFYHSTNATPEKFMGFMPRLDSTTGTAGGQIIKHDPAASGADQSSILIVGWGPDTVFGIYPKGSNAGIQQDDMGKQYVDDGSGSNRVFRAWCTNWIWKMGLVVKDYRYVVRIANIDATNLVATGSSLITSLVNGVNQLQDTNSVKPVIYVNRKIATYLQLQAMDTTKNSTLTIENVGGRPITSFMGIPVRMTEALTNTEAAIA